MRGGPGAQTPGNGGMKKHTPVTAESAAVTGCGTRRRRGPRHENFRKFAGRQIKFEYGRIFWVDSRVSTQKVCPYTNFGIWSARHEFQSFIRPTRRQPADVTISNVPSPTVAVRVPSRRDGAAVLHLEWRKYIQYTWNFEYIKSKRKEGIKKTITTEAKFSSIQVSHSTLVFFFNLQVTVLVEVCSKNLLTGNVAREVWVELYTLFYYIPLGAWLSSTDDQVLQEGFFRWSPEEIASIKRSGLDSKKILMNKALKSALTCLNFSQYSTSSLCGDKAWEGRWSNVTVIILLLLLGEGQ